MTTKDALHRAIEQLSDEEAEDLLDYLNLMADPDELTEEERQRVEEAEEAIRRGDSVRYESLDDMRRALSLDS